MTTIPLVLDLGVSAILSSPPFEFLDVDTLFVDASQVELSLDVSQKNS